MIHTIQPTEGRLLICNYCFMPPYWITYSNVMPICRFRRTPIIKSASKFDITWSFLHIFNQLAACIRLLFAVKGFEIASLQVSHRHITWTTLQRRGSPDSSGTRLVIRELVSGFHRGASCSLYSFNSCQFERVCEYAWLKLEFQCWSGVCILYGLWAAWTILTKSQLCRLSKYQESNHLVSCSVFKLVIPKYVTICIFERGWCGLFEFMLSQSKVWLSSSSGIIFYCCNAQNSNNLRS